MYISIPGKSLVPVPPHQSYQLRGHKGAQEATGHAPQMTLMEVSRPQSWKALAPQNAGIKTPASAPLPARCHNCQPESDWEVSPRGAKENLYLAWTQQLSCEKAQQCVEEEAGDQWVLQGKAGSVLSSQGVPALVHGLCLVPISPLKGLFFMMLLKVSYVLLRFSSIR